jgi:Domain of unknown function (DUF6754)
MSSQLAALALALIGAIALSIHGIRQPRRKRKGIDRVPAFGQLADEVGRVAEEGATIHVALGKGSILDEQGLTSIAALQGLHALTELAAAYDTPPFITTGDPMLFLLANNQLHDAYARLGNLRNYKSGLVRYTAPSPMLYAAMAATLSFDEPVNTSIVLGGFDQEASLLTDSAMRKGGKLFGGATSAVGIAALYSDIGEDRLIIGEEMFAGGAEVSDRSAFRASLRAEDLLRWLVVAGILVTTGASLLGLGG